LIFFKLDLKWPAGTRGQTNLEGMSFRGVLRPQGAGTASAINSVGI